MTPPPPPAAAAGGAVAGEAPDSGIASHENYFRFTSKHETFLLGQSRRYASALIVDTMFDHDKWRFHSELKTTPIVSASHIERDERGHGLVPVAQQPLEIFELRASALDRVACIAPKLASDPEQLAIRSHTLLGRTRVRGKLDELMAVLATRRRVVYQGMMASLHEGHLQHSDVFSSYEDDASVRDPTRSEQYALKYFIIEPTASASSGSSPPIPPSSSTSSSSSSSPASTSGTSSSSTSAAKRTLNFLRRKNPSDKLHHYPQSISGRSTTSSTSTTSSIGGGRSNGRIPDERIHFCVGEYATIRPAAYLIGDGDGNGTAEAEATCDQRIGIISYHSIEDPELLQLCNSVAKHTTPRALAKCSSRTLLQYSGIVAYQVPTADGSDELEVLIKVSCFDARGLSPAKRGTMLHYLGAFRNLAHMLLVMRLRASPFLSASNWIADARRKCCYVCQQRFSSLRRRHHCRLCGEITCGRCSAVHQVKLVQEAKCSLRICLLCVQGVERPQMMEREEPVAAAPGDDPAVNTVPPDPRINATGGAITTTTTQPEPSIDYHALVAGIVKPPSSPVSTSTDTSSPVELVIRGAGSLTDDSGPGQSLSIRDLRDSEFVADKPLKPISRRMVPEDLMSLHESAEDLDIGDLEASDVEEPEFLRMESPSIILRAEAVDEEGPLCAPLGEAEEDELPLEFVDEDKRFQCLSAYGLLEDAGCFPEDLTLQTIVKEAALVLGSAVAAIGFVDSSRDMLCATYSASPLVQVPRGSLPKQHSLTWEVMQRSATRAKPDEDSAIVILDTLRDPTLQTHPLVQNSPFVRSIVGAPITAWNGVIIGALLLTDIQPRKEVKRGDVQKIGHHAGLVESWLENRRRELQVTSKGRSGSIAMIHDRLADLLCTSYQTTLELQQRGMQMQNQRRPPRREDSEVHRALFS